MSDKPEMEWRNPFPWVDVIDEGETIVAGIGEFQWSHASIYDVADQILFNLSDWYGEVTGQPAIPLEVVRPKAVAE